MILDNAVKTAELAKAMGLSHHTIKRKLWTHKLPRPEYLQAKLAAWPLDVITAHLRSIGRDDAADRLVEMKGAPAASPVPTVYAAMPCGACKWAVPTASGSVRCTCPDDAQGAGGCTVVHPTAEPLGKEAE